MFSNIRAIFSGLTRDPAGTLIQLLFLASTVLISLILHECAHGYVAFRCGDPTAKWMGRLTLDPRKHLDPVGTLCMLFLGVGWARPVPVNPNNFRHYRRDYILVSLAGICVNFVLFLVTIFLYVLFLRFSGTMTMHYVMVFLSYMMNINIGLVIFNLIPVPPLDGYRFLDEFAFHGRLSMNPQTMQIIHFIFLFICISGMLNGALSTIRSTVISFFFRIFGQILY